jgi:RimJ/RimL family protein N-acetyltransferase
MFDTILWNGPAGPQDLHDYWTCNNRDWTCTDLDFDLAVIEKASDRYIGGVSLRPVNGDPAILDLGYALAPAWHGQGFATEGLGALVRHAFEERGAERIFATIFVGNHASRRVAEKLGFQHEGTLRRAVWKRGVWLDEWLYATTRPQWAS